MKRIALLFAAVLAVTGVGVTMRPAAADPADCENSDLSFKQVEIALDLGRSTGDAWSLGTGDAGIYIDDRGIDGNGQWIYLESNGVFGLQRGGTSPAGDTDPCNDGWTGEPDQLLF